MPCGLGGVPTGAGLVDGGVDQGPWLGGVAVCLVLFGGQGRVGLAGARARGVQGLRFRGGRW